MAIKPMRIFVSPRGSDEAPGTRAQPLATLTKARDAVRALKAAGPLSGPVEVVLRRGTYRMKEPLALGPEDSGTPECPITWMAAPGEKAVLSGGRVIKGWRKNRHGLWTVELPEVAAGAWYFRQLFVDGVRAVRSRWPEAGRLKVAGGVKDEPADDPENLKGFRFNAGDLRADWANREDVEVVVLQFWMEARLRIANLDEAGGLVTFTGGSWRPLTWNGGYFVENVQEQFLRNGKPGTWYLDRKKGVAMYRPLPGQTTGNTEIVAPLGWQLIKLAGDLEGNRPVRHVHFRGLSLQHTQCHWPREGHAITQAELGPMAAMEGEGVADCSVEDCEFAHLGGWAVDLGRGCVNNRIAGNTFVDVGAGCVKVGCIVPPRTAAEETGHTDICDNQVLSGSLLYLGAPAFLAAHSGHNHIHRNEVQGDFQWAVSLGWRWSYYERGWARDNVVEDNHVHHLGGADLGVHAALYALGVQPGTVFRRNLVHHVRSWPHLDHVPSGFGLILDNGCVAIIVEDNIFHHCDGGGVCTNFNVIGDIIQNNIFALGRNGQFSRYGDPAPKGEWMPNPIFFQRNLVYLSEGKVLWEEDWPNFSLVWDSNLFWDTRGPEALKMMGYDWEAWKAKGLDHHSVVADPKFADPENGDFTMPADSPAIKLGFKPIDLSGVGPRKKKE